MLKKLFLLTLAATAFAACNDDKNDGNDGNKEPSAGAATYSGTLEVTPQKGSPFAPFTESEIVFRLVEADAGAYALDMPKIKFVAEMPVYIAFEVRDLHPEFSGSGFAFSKEETTPYRNGAPYDPDGKGTYTIRNLQGASADGSALAVEFDCYTMHVKYTGTRE